MGKYKKEAKSILPPSNIFNLEYFHVGGSKGKNHYLAQIHDHTTLQANKIELASKGDTTLKGATATARRIDADVKGRLNIESVQDHTEQTTNKPAPTYVYKFPSAPPGRLRATSTKAKLRAAVTVRLSNPDFLQEKAATTSRPTAST